jgi:hypothetical protein
MALPPEPDLYFSALDMHLCFGGNPARVESCVDTIAFLHTTSSPALQPGHSGLRQRLITHHMSQLPLPMVICPAASWSKYCGIG